MRRGRICSPSILARAALWWPTTSIALSHDAQTVAVGDVHGGLTMVDVASSAVSRRHAVTDEVAIVQVSFVTADGLLAVVPEQGSALLWDPRIGAERMRLPARIRMIRGRAGVLDTAGTRIVRWRVGDAAASAIASAPLIDSALSFDRRTLLVLSKAGRVLRLRSGGRLEPMFAAPGAIAIAVSPRQDTVAVAHRSGVQLYSAQGIKGSWLATTESRLTDVVVSRDGRWCAASNQGGTVEVWDVRTGLLRAVLRGHRQRVSSLTIAPDGMLLSASWDGSVRVWNLRVLDVSPSGLVASAHAAWGVSLDTALRTWMY